MRAGLNVITAALLGSCTALLGACALPTDAAAPSTPVGGTSALVADFAQVAGETGLPAELLASMAYARTRFAMVDSEGHDRRAVGLFGLSPEDLAAGARLAGVTDVAARTNALDSLRASAFAIKQGLGSAHGLRSTLLALEPGMRSELLRVLVRGVFGTDEVGDSITIAAHRELADILVAQPVNGFGTTTEAVTTADYPGALWNPAVAGNFQVSNRGLTSVDHIVIHDTEGSYASSIAWFKDTTAKVSAHYILRSSDGELTQMVAEKDIAYHDKCFNTTTVGIEHEGFLADPDRWYTEAMYIQSAKLSAYLEAKYGIVVNHGNILGHGEAPDCSDHTDPGPGWDWDHYIDLVEGAGAAPFSAGDLSVEAPLMLVSGERATVTVAVTNNGGMAWDPDLTRLATAPDDRQSEFFVEGDWVDPAHATSVDALTARGETGTFTFDVIAPSVKEPQAFDEAFQLVEEATGSPLPFGPEVHIMLQVTPADVADGGGGGCNAGGSATGATSLLLLAVASTLRRRRR
ncbi:MAG TPA: peptidoglycan recognition family protein [Kofleriaceae bacterium]